MQQELNNQPNQFQPHHPEKKVAVEVTVRELGVLREIRESSSFAKIVIVKQNNVIVRVSLEKSLLVTHDGVKEAR